MKGTKQKNKQKKIISELEDKTIDTSAAKQRENRLGKMNRSEGKSQPQKVIYFMIRFIQHFYDDKIIEMKEN